MRPHRWSPPSRSPRRDHEDGVLGSYGGTAWHLTVSGTVAGSDLTLLNVQGLLQHGNKTVSGGYTQDNGTEKLNVDITREDGSTSRVTEWTQRDPRCADAEKCPDDSAGRVPAVANSSYGSDATWRRRALSLNQTVNDQLSASHPERGGQAVQCGELPR